MPEILEKLTDEQKNAVYDRGGALLVSAAAGSGKTRVLVARLLDRILHGADIDRFLVITFTKAAAAELRDRIAQELGKLLAEHPGDLHLLRQTVLLCRANISTVHSFCSRLLRENAAALEIDPDFRLCDEGEALILMQQTLDRLLDSRYETVKEGDDFSLLVDTLAAGQDDDRLVQIVLDVFTRIQSHPDPEAWLAEQERVWRLEGVDDAADTPWGKVVMQRSKEAARYAAYRLEKAMELAQTDSALSVKYCDNLARSIASVRALIAAERWDDMRSALPVPFDRIGSSNKGIDEEQKARIVTLRDTAKKRLKKLEEILGDDSRALLDDLRGASPAVCALMQLVRDFALAYAERKRSRGLADYSDLEHMALKLLRGEDGRPTLLAQSWSERLDEVMVDEFQDTNEVQDAIYRALSGGGRTLFVVGDVKQSIYRFRLADPTIFLKYLHDFTPCAGAREGEARKVTLSGNFRSRPEILSGVNDLFSDLMSAEFGEMDYTEDQRLSLGGDVPEDERFRVELDLISVPTRGEDEEQEDKVQAEARAAAARIRTLLDSRMPVRCEGGTRPLESSDVLILLRSPGPVLHHYTAALNAQGIPWSADMKEDFFTSTEVNVALSLLQIVDNPRQDVALISVLRSPIWGFSADRLAELRKGAQGDFYTVLQAGKERGEADCAAFLAELDRLRFGAGDRTCSQLIWHVYRITNLPALFSALPDGEKRRENLLALYELARAQEQGGCRTLFDFLLYLRRLQQCDKSVKEPVQSAGSGVRIMSIHASKGLEAPVVLVCGLSKQFNRDNLKRTVLFHPKLGVGPKYLMTERGIVLNTLARRAVAQQLERELMAEELRLLYVAMTRARDKLILSVAMMQAKQHLTALGEDAASPVQPQVLAERLNTGDWILLSALNRRSGAPLRALAGLGEAQTDYSPAWDVRVIESDAPAAETAETAKQEAPPAAPEPDVQTLAERFSWRYPYDGAVDVPSKITATRIKGRMLDAEAAEQTERPLPRQAPPLSRARFAEERLGLTPTQRGSALHLAMQFIDYGKTGDEGQIREEIERLVAQEFLTPQQGEAVDASRLAALFRSPLGREMTATQVHREYKFSLLVPAEEYYPQARGEQLLLQGVVDCWYDTPEGITVVDFKSDRVTKESAEGRARDYAPQLLAYARALEELTGRPVRRCVLWFFALDEALEVRGENNAKKL